MRKEVLAALFLVAGCAPETPIEEVPEETQRADLISYDSETAEDPYLEQEMTFETGDTLHIITDLEEGSLTVSLLDEELNPIVSEEEITGENDYRISPEPGTYVVSADGDDLIGSFSLEKNH